MQVENARQVSECGFCILEGVYDDGECEQMRSLFADGSVRLGGITAAAPRLVFHPLLELAPELAPFFANQSLIDTMAAVFQDDVRLAHSGAAVNDNALSSPVLTTWHNHYHWDLPPGGLQRERPERLLCNIYVDGTSTRLGPLVVLPRGLNDPLDAPGPVDEDWEGQVEVKVPPGSAVLFDTALWHCSRAGTAGLRHLWGGHYQGWGNATAHVEDNSADNPTLNRYIDEVPLLKGLLQAPGA
jgi:hypothetical protein